MREPIPNIHGTHRPSCRLCSERVEEVEFVRFLELKKPLGFGSEGLFFGMFQKFIRNIHKVENTQKETFFKKKEFII